MGSGIAQVAAASGLNVIMHDITLEYASRGKDNIGKNLLRQLEKGKITAERMDDILARITPSTDLAKMQAVDFVVEAASEKEDIKFELFNAWTRSVPPMPSLPPTPRPFPSAGSGRAPAGPTR